MANFDSEKFFEDLTNLTPTKYEKQWLKDKKNIRQKAKGALVLTKLMLNGKNTNGVIAHFPKAIDTIFPRKFWNEDIKTKAKKSGSKAFSVKLVVEEVEGVEHFTLSKSTGVYDPSKIYEGIKHLFPEGGPRSLKVDGLENGTDNTTVDETSDTPETSTDNNVSDFKTLNQTFTSIKISYTEAINSDAKEKMNKMRAVWDKIATYLPTLEQFIANSDNATDKENATKISENTKKIKVALHKKIKDQQGEASNNSLDTLTSGIGKKAAQLLSKYEDQIKGIDGLADKLKSISEIA